VKRLASLFSLGVSLQDVTGLRCIAAPVSRVAMTDGGIAPRLHRTALVGGGMFNPEPMLRLRSGVKRR
jgi:hypothetical protein